MNTIKCTNCGLDIEVDKALEGQIEARVLATAKHEHQAEIAKIRENTQEQIKKELASERELLQQQAQGDLEMARQKLELEAAIAQKKAIAGQEMLVHSLRADSESKEAALKQMREQLTELMQTLRLEKSARQNAELDMQKKLSEGEDKIRQDTMQSAEEKYRLKIAESEKKLTDTQKALDDAQRKATQGSQQGQGEVLELDLEERLRSEFPYDSIDEVKKGERGADIKQTVKNQLAADCGMLLWETKNGKWQPAWIAKFKADIRAAGASIGVIVSNEIPTEMGDMKHLETTVWVVKPRLAVVLAAALRGTILQVDAANKMNAGKDAKMEALYQYLVGTDYRHRIEAIVENYGQLQAEIEKEKRASALRWAHQEKSIRAVIDNTIGMYGDLQGITNRALPAIKSLELDEPATDADTEVLMLL